MASLNHVSIRDKEYGWIHITPEDASRLFPNETVSSNDHVLYVSCVANMSPLQVTVFMPAIFGTAVVKKSKTVMNAQSNIIIIQQFNMMVSLIFPSNSCWKAKHFLFLSEFLKVLFKKMIFLYQ